MCSRALIGRRVSIATFRRLSLADIRGERTSLVSRREVKVAACEYRHESWLSASLIMHANTII